MICLQDLKIVKDIEMESDEERIFRDFLSSSLHPLKLLLLARKFSLHKALVEKTSYSSIENFLSCFSKTRQLVEILEHNQHPYYIGVQFHPEYKSTVASPHPLFISFIEASLLNKQNDLLNATREKI